MNNASGVTETILFTALKQKCVGERPPISCDNIAALCEQASGRMKQMATVHAHFTSHEAVHSLRVSRLMGLILGED